MLTDKGTRYQFRVLDQLWSINFTKHGACMDDFKVQVLCSKV